MKRVADFFFLHFTGVLKTSCWADFVHFQNSNRLQKITRLSSKWHRLLTSPNKTNNEHNSSQYSDSFIVTCEVTFNAAEKIKNNSLVAQKTSKWEKTWRPKDGDDWNGLKMSAKFWLTRLAYLCLDCQITLLFFTFFFFAAGCRFCWCYRTWEQWLWFFSTFSLPRWVRPTHRPRKSLVWNMMWIVFHCSLAWRDFLFW